MNTEILVSIVINNYNYGHFLRDAIDSALQQTYRPIEVIVVDDGSTDDSRATIAAYGRKIRPILKANGGQASAFNAGFARCQGDLIIFLDADDVLLPDTVQRVVSLFCDKPQLARIQYRLEVVDAAGRPTGMLVPPAYLALASGDLRLKASSLVNGTNWPPTSGNAFAAWTLRRILPMPEAEFRTCADYYLLRANALCGPVAALDEVGAYYRLHGRNNLLTPTLGVEHIRRQILLTQKAHERLQSFVSSDGEQPGTQAQLSPAGIGYEVGNYTELVEKYDEIYLAQRIVSLKLEPRVHPVAGDTVFGLFRLGVRAAVHRADLSPLLKAVHIAWFMAMLLTPRSLAHRISRHLLPSSRASADPLLKALQSVG